MKSLERQLQLALAVVLILILLGLVIIANLSTKKLLTEFVSSRLELDAQRILDTLDARTHEVKVRWGRLNPVYRKPVSGHYFAIKTQDKSNIIYSPSLKQTQLIIPNDSELVHGKPTIVYDAKGPEGQHLIVWTKAFNKNGQGVIVSVAEDMSHLMKNRKHFSLVFLAIGALGLLLLLGLQHFVIHRLFKRLDKSRQEIKQVGSGKLQQLSEDVPTEIYPLVKEFNQSLSTMQQRMERSRNSLGNLAHALKTPLSLLIQQLEGEKVDPDVAINHAERIRQLTERELKRARMAGLGNTTQRFDPREELTTLIEVLKQAHQKKSLTVNLYIDDKITTFGDREDMLELIGNLLDNAFKWASSQVDISLSTGKGTSIQMMIEDDGKNIHAKELEQLTQRGIRLDESIEGHGLGLAICKDIVKLYGGTMTFDLSPTLSGLRVNVVIPQ